MNQTTVRAVIFDLDGLLIDSMFFYLKAWTEAFRQVGVRMPKEEVYRREGEAMEVTAFEVYRAVTRKEPSQELIHQIVESVNRIYSQIFDVRFLPGANEILEYCKGRGIARALVTGSRNLRAKFSGNEEFLDNFDVVVTGNDTKRGKPFPDPYEKAVEKLALPRENCIVVENAPLGIQSATVAGLTCVGVIGNSPLTAEVLRQAGASIVCTNLLELRDLLCGRTDSILRQN